MRKDSSVRWGLGLIVAAAIAWSGSLGRAEDAPVSIVVPQVDKAAHAVMLPGAFWNQKLASWVEVVFCGRPSDFLHETIVCVTTTRAGLEGAMREAGFQDADAWAGSVRDFAKVRGDRFLILLSFERDGKKETWSLEELLTFEGWNTPVGPYGFMFKGDPERNVKAETQGAKPEGGTQETDGTKILRDDPQIALTFKGLQHQSQSFADHPLAYDDWIYPMMAFARNYKKLPAEVLDSNGKVPATVTIQKVGEEELLTLSAKYAHDDAYRDYILKQVEVGKQLDKDRAAIAALLPSMLGTQNKGAAVNGQGVVLMEAIANGYAQLDSAWATWVAEHAGQDGKTDEEQRAIVAQAKRWQEHAALHQQAAAAKWEAAKDLLRLQELAQGAGGGPEHMEMIKVKGDLLKSNGQALIAENSEPLAYWKGQEAKLDPADNAKGTWEETIRANLTLMTAKQAAAEAQVVYGETLVKLLVKDVPVVEHDWSFKMIGVQTAQAKLDLVSTNFEISKREGTDDPELPRLRAIKAAIEEKLERIRLTEGVLKQLAASQPASQPTTQQ